MSIPFKYISYEEGKKGLLSTLYKYRTWSNDLHKTILSKQVVYLSNPLEFKDPFDCKIVKRYDLLTPLEIYNIYYNMSVAQYPGRYDFQHRDHANQWFHTSPMFDKDYLLKFQNDYHIDFNNRFGVLSLTANPKNLKM